MDLGYGFYGIMDVCSMNDINKIKSVTHLQGLAWFITSYEGYFGMSSLSFHSSMAGSLR
jgi:hypothetical protein